MSTSSNAFLVHVIPIARGISSDELSYFSTSKMPLGSVITVPVRRRNVPAVVIGVESAREAKSQIRSKSFSLKKAAGTGAYLFTPAFIEAAFRTAFESAGTIGGVLASFHIEENVVPPKKRISDEEKSEKKIEPAVVHGTTADRFAAYRKLIREEFARGRSVLFIVPERALVPEAYEMLSRGIESYTFSCDAPTGRRKNKAREKTWKAALEMDHPCLFITVPPFMSLPRDDWGAIVIDRESHRSYKSWTRPFVDYRLFGEYYGQNLGARFVLGDSLLRLETFYRLQEHTAQPLTPTAARLPEGGAVEVISWDKEEPFSVITPELREHIARALTKKGKAFVFSGRRGLAPTTVCRDCGEILTCPRCSAPAALHKKSGQGNGRQFACHRCGFHEPAEDKCSYCKSWRLVPLGIGSEGVEEELKKLFPDAAVLRLDSDTATTPVKAARIAEKFKKARSDAILVGTETALFRLPKHMQLSAVASADAVLSLPDLRINERVLRIANELQQKSDRLVIQTRMPDHLVFETLATGIGTDFYRAEQRSRKKFNFPPFSVLIKISAAGRRGSIEKSMEKLAEKLDRWDTTLFPAFTERVKGKSVFHLLVQVPRRSWPDKELLSRLRGFPPSVRIEVDPESIL